MTRFTLRSVDDDGTVTVKQFESLFLDDVVDKTADFFRGVGFVFDELSIVNDDAVSENSKSVYSQYRHTD